MIKGCNVNMITGNQYFKLKKGYDLKEESMSESKMVNNKPVLVGKTFYEYTISKGDDIILMFRSEDMINFMEIN